MKTIIYPLFVITALLCTSAELLSQERDIGVIRDSKAMLTNTDNALAYFKAAYGPSVSVTGLNIQWSREHNSYFLVGKTNVRGVTGLQINATGGGLKATAGPGMEISCVPEGDCFACDLSDAICYCTQPQGAALCMSVIKFMFINW